MRLDPKIPGPETAQFEADLLRLVKGQERAVRRMVRVYEMWRAGIAGTGRPVANLLMLGPTGSGKTRLVEAMAEVLFGKPDAMVKVNCAEFQHSHEIAKLVGSPPGYLGHRETTPAITQERLEKYFTEKIKLALVLFDEIEKANDALWQLLLGILDKATLTLGDNRTVDFSRSIVFLTSNLGSHEISKLLDGGIGFRKTGVDADEMDQKIYKVAKEATAKKFTPEFMNRIDRLIVFRQLQRPHLQDILSIELAKVQERIMACASGRQFVFTCTDEARDFLLDEGTDAKFGARHLKRALERHLVFPFSSLLASGQIECGDSVSVGMEGGKPVFDCERGGALSTKAVSEPFKAMLPEAVRNKLALADAVQAIQAHDPAAQVHSAKSLAHDPDTCEFCKSRNRDKTK